MSKPGLLVPRRGIVAASAVDGGAGGVLFALGSSLLEVLDTDLNLLGSIADANYSTPQASFHDPLTDQLWSVSTNDTLTLTDVADLENPVRRDTEFGNTTPRGVAGDGVHAFLAAFGLDAVRIYEASNPAAMTLAGSVADAATLDGASGLAYDPDRDIAFVAVNNLSRLAAVYVGNRSAPSVLGTVQDVTRLLQVWAVAYHDGFVYTLNKASTTSCYLACWDVSNPAAPVFVRHYNNSTELSVGGNEIRVDPTTERLYITSVNRDALLIFDISDPATAMPLLGSVADATIMDGAQSVDVLGDFAFVACQNAGRIVKVDVSNPAAPAIVTSRVVTGATSVSARRAAAALPSSLTDDFSEADSTTMAGKAADTGGTWSVLAGTMDVTASAARSVTVNAAGHAVAVVAGQTADAELSAVFGAVPANQRGVGIVYRATDANSYRFVFAYRNLAGASLIYSGRVEGGVTTYDHLDAMPAADAISVGDTLAVRFVGTAIRVFWNGAQIAAVHSSFNQAATSHGVLGVAADARGIGSISVDETPTPEATGVRAIVDTFNRKPLGSAPALGTSDSGHAWSDLTGVWTINSQARAAANAAGQSVSVVDGAFSDGVAELVLGSVPGNITSVGIAYRVTDANNMRFVFLNKSSGGVFGIYSGKVEGGVVTYDDLSNAAVPDTPTVGDVLRVEFSGSSIVVRWNGTQVGAGFSSTLGQSATKHGLFGNSTGDGADSLTVTPA